MKTLAVFNPYSYSLYFTSGVFARQTEKLAREIWAPSGLHPSHAQLLLLVFDSNFPYPTIFAKALLLNTSTITRLLEKLEQRGLISRANYERLTYVTATAKAWELEPVLRQCERNFADRCHEILGEPQTEELASLMMQATDKLANCPASDGKSGPE